MGRGFGIEAAVPIGVISLIAAEAEALGYSSFWVNNPPGVDGLASLAAAASVTERVKLGVGVIPLDRHPASEIATLVDRYELPMERLLLGVGSGGQAKGLPLVRDGVERLRSQTAARVIISALGPRMSRLGGEIADGVLFNWFTPEFERCMGQLVGDAAEQAGRPRPWVMAYVRCGLLPQAEDKLNERATRYASIPQYARHFARMAVSARDTCVSSADAAVLQAGIACRGDGWRLRRTRTTGRYLAPPCGRAS